jgi:glycosyltransferase involved in cell wall biosynthesis
MPALLSINNYHYYRGGAETVFLEQNRLFSDAGWSVVPFAMAHPKNLPTPWSRFFVDEIEMGGEYSLAGKIARAGKVIYSIEARRKLDALMLAARPDVAHAHNIYHHISPSILGLLQSRGIPTVVTLHDLKIACPAYNMLRGGTVCERCKGGHIYNVLRHRCIKGSTVLSAVVLAESVVHRVLGSYTNSVNRFIVPSRFYVNKLIEWGFTPTLFQHVPNFVDSRRYEPDFQPGKAFLYFGRLSPEKGLATLVRAAAAARVPLVLAGTGAQADELKRLAEQLGADVSFLGYLTGAPLHDAIRRSRAVVLPSEWYENAPMSILEAYALGKPAIGASIGGIPELIRPDETGLCFGSGNVDELTHMLGRVAALPDQRLGEWGRNGRNWVESAFTAELYRERVIAVYRGIGVNIAAPAA